MIKSRANFQKSGVNKGLFFDERNEVFAVYFVK